MVLGLEIGIDIVETDPSAAPGEIPVRPFRRITQIKIKEEADRRRIEEETLHNIKIKKPKKESVEKQRRKKHKDSDEDIKIKEVDRLLRKKEEKLNNKRKKKEGTMKFNEAKL